MNPATLPGPRWLRHYARLLGWLDTAAGWLIIAAITVMVLVVSIQVALRYGLNSSIGWADEVSRLTFVWSMFLAIPLGIRAGAHIGIEILTVKLPSLLRNVLLRVIAVLSTALMLLVCWESALICWEQSPGGLELQKRQKPWPSNTWRMEGCWCPRMGCL